MHGNRGRRCRLFLASVMVLAATVAGEAGGQTFPTRPITLIIPVSAGSGIEATFRMLAAEASKFLGQPIVAENRTGAGGRIGMNAVMAASKDGYVIGMVTTTILITAPAIDPKLFIEPGKDYTPVALTNESYFIIAAHPSVSFRDLKGLVSYAKANPGKLTVTGITLGSAGHLTWEMLKSTAGIDVTIVPYREQPLAVANLLNGQLHAMAFSTAAKPYVESGRLIGIATTGPRRWDLFPELPTMIEAGQPIMVDGWYGVVAPAGTPAAIVAKLNEAFLISLNKPEVIAKHKQLGLVPRSSTPEEFTKHIRSEIDRWTPIIRKMGIKFE